MCSKRNFPQNMTNTQVQEALKIFWDFKITSNLMHELRIHMKHIPKIVPLSLGAYLTQVSI